MSKTLQKLFPGADEIFQEIENKNEIPISNLQTIAAELERGVFPRLSNSSAVVKMHNFEKNIEIFRLGEEMEKFVDYLEPEECHELLRHNKMVIHTDLGEIFDNVNSGRKYF